MKTFSLFLEDTGYQGGTAPIVEPPKVDPVSGTALVKSEDDPMKEEDTDDIDEVAAIRSVNKELADIALDNLDEALEKIQEVLATIGVTFDQESAKSALASSDEIEVALHDNPTDAAEPIAIYGKDDEGKEEPGELTLCVYKDGENYKGHLHIYFGEEKMRLSDISLEDKDSDETEVTEEEGEEDKNNPVDVVKMDIPLFIRMLEFAREDAVDDEQLHAVTERITKMAAEGDIITMAEYDKIVGASTEEKESEDPNKDPNASEIKKQGHIEVYESKSKSLESFLKESSEDDSPQVVVYLKGKDVRSKVVKNKHAAHLVIKTEKADGIISITPVDTDEINKAKDQADTVKKDAKVKAKKKLENEAKKVAQLPMDEDEGQGIPPHGSENMEMDQTDKLTTESMKDDDIIKLASQHGFKSGGLPVMDKDGTKRITMTHPSGHVLNIASYHHNPNDINKHYRGQSTWSMGNGNNKVIAMGHDVSQLTHELGKVSPMTEADMDQNDGKNGNYSPGYEGAADKDRGSSRNPHKFVNGKKIPLTDPKEIAAYDAAYKGASTDKGTDNARPRGATDRPSGQYGEEMQEEDSAKVIGDIVKIASGPMKELPHGNDLHKVIDVQDGKLLIQPWDQETEKPFPLKNIKYPHSAVLVDAADITSHDLLGMDIRLKEEGEGDDQYPVHNGEKNEEDEEEDDDSLTRPMTH